MMKAYANENSRPALLLEAQIALAEAPARDPGNAALKARASDLQTWVALHPEDALAWGALGETWDRLGVPLRSLRAEAESRYAMGDLGRRRRAASRWPAHGARRWPGGLHRRVGHRFAAAGYRGPDKADPGGSARIAGALRQRLPARSPGAPLRTDCAFPSYCRGSEQIDCTEASRRSRQSKKRGTWLAAALVINACLAGRSFTLSASSLFRLKARSPRSARSRSSSPSRSLPSAICASPDPFAIVCQGSDARRCRSLGQRSRLAL